MRLVLKWDKKLASFFGLRSSMSLDLIFDSGTSRGKTFIFIFLIKILSSILSGIQSCQSVLIQIRIAVASRDWLALRVTQCIGRWFLDDFPLRSHQIIPLFGSFGSDLISSLNYIRFDSTFWIVGIANPLRWPLPAIWWGFWASTPNFLDIISLGLRLLMLFLLGILLQVTPLMIPFGSVWSLSFFLEFFRFQHLFHENNSGSGIWCLK